VLDLRLLSRGRAEENLQPLDHAPPELFVSAQIVVALSGGRSMHQEGDIDYRLLVAMK
jgi:hypothetical protein